MILSLIRWRKKKDHHHAFLSFVMPPATAALVMMLMHELAALDLLRGVTMTAACIHSHHIWEQQQQQLSVFIVWACFAYFTKAWEHRYRWTGWWETRGGVICLLRDGCRYLLLFVYVSFCVCVRLFPLRKIPQWYTADRMGATWKKER